MKLSLMIKLTTYSCFALTVSQSFAAISLDRTRVIFPGDQKSISMTVSNDNKQLPYLAQGWLENEKGEKITTPFTVLPPVQRVEPGTKTIIKIQEIAGGLPQDRESLFYFNLREIPPRSDKPNVLQLALQTKIKMFYRPASLMTSTSATTPWQESLTLNRNGEHVIARNPTPYYITINSAHAKGGKTPSQFRAVMLAPNSDSEIGISSTALGATPELEYINDYGGRPTLTFHCDGSACRVISNKVGG